MTTTITPDTIPARNDSKLAEARARVAALEGKLADLKARQKTLGAAQRAAQTAIDALTADMPADAFLRAAGAREQLRVYANELKADTPLFEQLRVQLEDARQAVGDLEGTYRRALADLPLVHRVSPSEAQGLLSRMRGIAGYAPGDEDDQSAAATA